MIRHNTATIVSNLSAGLSRARRAAYLSTWWCPA